MVCSKCGIKMYEKNPVKESRNVIVENGVKKAIVKQLDGNYINVPVVPNKVLFLGNSLLLGMSNYSYGMCATDDKSDYYYHVTQAILKKNPNCKFDKAHLLNFESIESSEDFETAVLNTSWKNSTHLSIGDTLTPDVDLVIVQGGDNINNDRKKVAFSTTCNEFVKLIKKKCPQARIIWVYGWYNTSNVYEPIQKVELDWKIETINLSSVKTSASEAKSGQTYIDENGCSNIVSEEWITHPGNEGMKQVADLIIEKLGI